MARVLVVADDLTGGNATAAAFATRGVRSVTVLEAPGSWRDQPASELVVVDTASRDCPEAVARRRVRAALASAPGDGLVVKRIDTTLRGNLGAEIDEALTALDDHGLPARALLVPAFPEAGRTTVGGLQLVDGRPLGELGDPSVGTASRVAAIVAQQCRRAVTEVPLDVVGAPEPQLRAALRGEADVVVCDATDDAHLRRVARAAAALTLQEGRRWLSVDPGPFAVELAEALGLWQDRRVAAPLLVVAGSNTVRTREQLVETERSLRAAFVDVDMADADARALAAALEALAGEAGPHGVFGLRVANTEATRVAGVPEVTALLGAVAAATVERLPVGGLYLTGGDTAAAVLRALGADGVEVTDEILPLAAAGRLVGGPREGLAVATKGGLVGGGDAAVACLQHLRAAGAPQR